MTSEQLFNTLLVIIVALCIIFFTRKETSDWIVILVIFSFGLFVMASGALFAWIFDEINYFPRWLLLHGSIGRSSFRAVPLSYGLIAASILLALRRVK